MAKKQVVNGDSKNLPISPNLPISLNIKVEGKSAYKVNGQEVERKFSFDLPFTLTSDNVLRVVDAVANRKFAEFVSGLKSRDELATMTDEDVIEKFSAFLERWSRGEKASRTAREFSLADAAEMVLVSHFRRQGAPEKDAKQKAKAARVEAGELWQKALRKVQEGF